MIWGRSFGEEEICQMRSEGGKITAILSIILMLSVLVSIPVASEELPRVVSMSNRYLAIYLGVKEKAKIDKTINNRDNAFGHFEANSVDWDIAGRWLVLTAEGDPETTKDNNWPLIMTWFNVNDGLPMPCDNMGSFKVKVGDKVYVVGDGSTGYWSKVPTVYTAPRPGIGAGRTGGFIEAEWTIGESGAPLVAFGIRMSIVRDQCRFELTVTNKAATVQSIGVEMTGDVMVDWADRSGYAYLPGTGYVPISGMLVPPYGQLLSGSSIPAYFEVYDNVQSPTIVARNTLKLQDCVAPDYVAIGDWHDLAGVEEGKTLLWLPNDYTPDPMKPVEDLAWVLCWSPRALGSGMSRKIVTYYGVGAASAVWNYKVGTRMEPDHVVLALQGPRSLKYDSTVTGKNDLDPSPFEIKAYIYNMATDPGPYDLEDVTVTLYLPPGLELSRSVTQTAQQSIGRVPANSEAMPATWTVQATGEYCGELEYFVTARAASGWQQVASRKIMVPATKKFVFRSGWQMMHVPFTFNNPSIEHAFNLPVGSFAARYYDPTTGQYLPVKQLTPGQAFWMYVGNVKPGSVQPHKLVADAAIVGEEFGKQSREQYVELKPGWNLVGNPLIYPVYWGQVEVYNKYENITVSIDEAARRNWISKTVFSWVPESGTYENFKDNDKLLNPWRGYWIRARYPVTLIFRPPVHPGSDVTALPGGYSAEN